AQCAFWLRKGEQQWGSCRRVAEIDAVTYRPFPPGSRGGIPDSRTCFLIGANGPDLTVPSPGIGKSQRYFIRLESGVRRRRSALARRKTDRWSIPDKAK